MKKLMGLFSAVVFMAMIFSGNPASAKIKLTYSTHFPAQHVQCKAAMDWAKEIEKRTQGEVQITVFPGGTLTSLPQLYDGVVKGISDIGFGIFGISGGRFPVMSALDLPVGYPSGLAASKAANDFANKFNPKEIQDVKLLYLHAHGPGVLMTKKPVRTLADVKGLKIRSTGTSAKVVSALGGVPVAMPISGTYEALQKGVAEGTFVAMEALKFWNLGEVTSSVTKCDSIGYTTTFYVVMNKAKWDSLPAPVKKVFEDVSREWIEVHGKIWDDSDKQGAEFAKEKNNEIIELSNEENARWSKAVQPVITEYISKTPDGEKYISTLRELVQSYGQ